MQPDPFIVTVYAGDYDYSSSVLTKHLTSWTDGRVPISGQSQQDAFSDRDSVGVAVASAIRPVAAWYFTQPTDFIINMTVPVDPATIQASDFTVNGVPADSLTTTRR